MAISIDLKEYHTVLDGVMTEIRVPFVTVGALDQLLTKHMSHFLTAEYAKECLRYYDFMDHVNSVDFFVDTGSVVEISYMEIGRNRK